MGRETLPVPAPPAPVVTTPNPTSPVVAPQAPPTSLAPGFRFHPTDEELVIYYLKRKVCGKTFRFDVISEVDIYRSDPWHLADKSNLKTRDQEWYFFSALDKKYGNGGRMNRATSKGYWKATGNDRPVRHGQRTVGLKKTLVFHSGRAPDGKRTNWVMHEYRLVDEELERAGIASTQDAYVLCRVFHKNNIGPPNGQRYAPFIEEEWDDSSAMIPGPEPVKEATAVHRPLIEGNGHVGCFEGTNAVQIGEHVFEAPDEVVVSFEKDTHSINKAPLDVNKLPIETQNLLAVCKRESMAEYPSPERDNSKSMDEYPSPQTDNPKPFSLIYKRRRHNLNSYHSNVPEHSARNSQDPCSSIITTAATTLPTMTTTTSASTSSRKHFLSALVEFSLLESLEPKESPSLCVPEFNSSTLDSPLPPSCMKFIQQLQDEVRKLSVERETMKFEVMSAQAMINILQSRIDMLTKENKDLKRGTENA